MGSDVDGSVTPRLFQAEDHGRFFRHLETGEIGQLEAPPLYDRENLSLEEEKDTGILWVPCFSDDEREIESDHWFYVQPKDVECWQEQGMRMWEAMVAAKERKAKVRNIFKVEIYVEVLTHDTCEVANRVQKVLRKRQRPFRFVEVGVVKNLSEEERG